MVVVVVLSIELRVTLWLGDMLFPPVFSGANEPWLSERCWDGVVLACWVCVNFHFSKQTNKGAAYVVRERSGQAERDAAVVDTLAGHSSKRHAGGGRVGRDAHQQQAARQDRKFDFENHQAGSVFRC